MDMILGRNNMHYIHCHQGVDLNKGGTVGYLSSLLDGMQKIGSFESDDGLTHAFLFPNIGPNERLPNHVEESLKFHTPFSIAYEDSEHLKYRNSQEWFHSLIPLSEAIKVNYRKITSIHIHGAYNFLPVYNMLRLAGIENDVVKILTTHNPWKPEEEDIFHFNKNKSQAELQRDLPKEAAYRHFLRMRDDFAFRMSDVLLFPTEHSMDGYYESWPEFADIVKDKPVYFTITGTEKKEVNLSREQMRKSLGIPEDAKVFLYLGRFIPMRGFDLYEKVAEQIINKHENAYFLAVGEKREKPSIKSDRWIEVGYTTSPGDYLNMSDAVVMANRGSYFDLGMIETLSLGTHLIAAKVGGYKYLEGKTKGVTFFEKESEEGLLKACDDFCFLEAETIQEGRLDNIRLYESEMTPEMFATNYKKTIDKMYEELDIKPRDRNIVKVFYPKDRSSKENAQAGNAQVKAQKPNIQREPANTIASVSNIKQKPRSKEQEAVELFEKGLFQPSIEAFYEAINQDGGSPRLRRKLAEVLYAVGNKGEAINQLELARKQIPENKNLRKRVLKMKYGKLAFWVKDSSFI
jgi:glycosyltransferase involved in cell wall biosynthesis